MPRTLQLTTNDGHVVLGPTPAALVRGLRATQWNAPDTKREYMEQVADRVATMYGAQVRPETPARFLRDLERAQLVTITVVQLN